MNHFTDNANQTADTPEAPATSSAPSIPPVDPESTLQQIEKNLSRLTDESDHSVAPSSNFDALDYARLSAAPRKSEFGEADPYVDSSETIILHPAGPRQGSGQSEPDEMPPAKTIDEILQKLSGYQTEIESNENTEVGSTGADSPNLDSEPSATEGKNDSRNDGPEVEVIAQSKHIDSPTAGDVPLVSSIPESTTEPAEDEAPPIAWFTDGMPAADEPANTSESDTILLDAGSTMAVPLVNAINDEDPESTEVIYDVRDFGDCIDGVVELIPGSQEVEPDFFEFNVGNKSIFDTMEPTQSQSFWESGQDSDQNNEDQIFVADHGDVIRIDGNDGFSYIDLGFFEVQQATFQKQVIKIDSGDGDVFEVHHQNIPYALFADGVEVDLIPDEAPG